MTGKGKTGRALIFSCLAGVIIFAPVAMSRGLDFNLPFSANATVLSDAAFTAGLLLTGIGSLIWVSCTGFFDIFAYGFHSLLVLFSPLRDPVKHQKYYDYRLSREEKRKKPEYAPLIVGGSFLILSALLLL